MFFGNNNNFAIVFLVLLAKNTSEDGLFMFLWKKFLLTQVSKCLIWWNGMIFIGLYFQRSFDEKVCTYFIDFAHDAEWRWPNSFMYACLYISNNTKVFQQKLMQNIFVVLKFIICTSSFEAWKYSKVNSKYKAVINGLCIRFVHLSTCISYIIYNFRLM